MTENLKKILLHIQIKTAFLTFVIEIPKAPPLYSANSAIPQAFPYFS